MSEKLQAEIDALCSDERKWEWVANNQNTGVVVILDNDDTFAAIPGKDDDDVYFRFDNYIGNGPGVPGLLDSFNIKSQSC